MKIYLQVYSIEQVYNIPCRQEKFLTINKTCQILCYFLKILSKKVYLNYSKIGL